MGEQRPFGELITYKDALNTVMEITPLMDKIEYVSLSESVGRVLAEDVKSDMSVPPFARAAMDGFAVKADDTYGAGKFDPNNLEVTGNIHAGDSPELVIEKGKCTQIATGAPIPEGADAVVKVENTELDDGGIVQIYEPVHPGQNVSPRGEDIDEGEVVLKKNEFLTSAKIGALAAMGKEKVKVYRKPRICIIPTGDEVVPPGDELKPGQIYDVNSYTLTSMILQNGGEPTKADIVHDTIEGLKEEIKKKAGSFDMVLFSGGSSVGDKDLVVDAIRSIGEVIFHGVKLKPGKPTLFGRVDGTLVIGMPGYPTSCLNTAQQLIRPAIRKMARLPSPSERTKEAILAKRIVSSLGRQQYMTVKLDGDKAYPVYKQSGAITSMAQADGYFEIPENVELVDKGQKITVTFF
ncbi:MAG: gephyrin-like molybdotransferase Glp [Thermoplasmatota archaeon]